MGWPAHEDADGFTKPASFFADVLCRGGGGCGGGLAWPWSLSAQNAAGGSATKRNVLVLLTDDQTFNTIHMLGNGVIQTPNLDRLAAQGTTLSHCFNQGAWHGAICVASRAMMNSGRNMYRITEPSDDRKAGNLDTDFTLWAEHFRGHGYTTFGTGKWHSGGGSFARSFAQGDAVHLGGMHRYSKERGNGGGPITLGHAYPDLFHYDGANGEFEKYDAGQTRSTGAFATAATTFLDTRRGAADPFFAYVSLSAHTTRGTRPRNFSICTTRRRSSCRPTSCPSIPSTSGPATSAAKSPAWPRSSAGTWTANAWSAPTATN